MNKIQFFPKLWLSLIISVFCFCTVFGQAVTMIKDINSGPNDSGPFYITEYNGQAFFVANDGAHGLELWKSDGTEAGTVLVKDINLGAASSFNPTNLAQDGFLEVFNGELFFGADDGSNGFELWKTDGTTGGTLLVKDIRSGSSGSFPSELVISNGILFFEAHDGTNGYELWKTDGTTAGTEIVKNIRTGVSNSYPNNLTDVNGTLFFAANDGSKGEELWKTDGTEAGTVRVKDIRSGLYSSNPDYLVDLNGTLFFAAQNSSYDRELWKSDGTEAGTVMVKDVFGADLDPRALTVVNNTLFFTGVGVLSGGNGRELWKTDGTEAGTVLVKDIRPGGASSGIQNVTAGNGLLFFRANDGSGTSGVELWKSDGTEAGTNMLKDIRPGHLGSSPGKPVSADGTIYFSANDGTNGKELWKSDGTSSGTQLVADINPKSGSSGPFPLANIDGDLYFGADDGVHGKEFWKIGGCDDSDTDGICDSDDNCPSDPNPGQEDTDTDGNGDACDPCPNDPYDDADTDGICGNVDNCPYTPNPGQENADGDTNGDSCDPCPLDPDDDIDADGLCANEDNCPGTANADQADLDGDGTGDACDPYLDFAGAVTTLTTYINGLGIPGANGLINKLEQALDKCNDGKPTSAINQLNAFINQVEDFRGDPLTNVQADYLVASAQAIIDGINDGTIDCSGSSSLIAPPNNSMINTAQANAISLLPNPASKKVTLQLDSSLENGTINLMDVDSKLMRTWGLTPGTLQYDLDIAGLKSGVYLVQVLSKKETIVKKLVVE